MNDDAFRRGLAGVITKDSYFQQHIQNGWHSIAIEKGLIGGEVLPVKDLDRINESLDKNERSQGEKINGAYQKMINEIKTLPKVLSTKFAGVSDDKKTESKARLQIEIAKLKALKPVGHKNAQDLQEKKAQAGRILSEIATIFKDLTNKSGIDPKKYNIDNLLVQLGDVTGAQAINPNVKLENNSGSPTFAETVKTWNNMQEQYPSDETRTRITDVYMSPENHGRDVPLTPLQQICAKVVTTLQEQDGTSGNIFDPEKPRTSKQRDRGLYTIAVGVVPSDKTTLYVAINYFNDVTGKPLTEEQKIQLLDTIRVKHGPELKKQGIDKLLPLERDPSTRPKCKFACVQLFEP